MIMPLICFLGGGILMAAGFGSLTGTSVGAPPFDRLDGLPPLVGLILLVVGAWVFWIGVKKANHA